MKIRIVPVAAGLAAATGLAITGASLANAEATSSTEVARASVAVYGETQPSPGQPPGGNGTTDPSKPLRDDEELLAGDVAAKVTAAAKAKEPDATIERVETDSEGAYEAHMVRADGTRITVQINKSYAVTNVQEGGPGGRGRGSEGTGEAQTPTPSATT